MYRKASRSSASCGFWGAAFILTLFMYPYVYLLSGAAFRTLHASLEEASRVFGRTPLQTLFHVTLPALHPGLTAGALLVALDILAEYGTVALLRYETFSSAIFVQLSGRYDRSAASVLSGILVAIAILILWGEIRLQGRARFTQMESNWRPAPPAQLGTWRIPAFFLVAGVVSASLLVPVGVLLVWSVQALLDPQTMSVLFHTGSQGTVPCFERGTLWDARIRLCDLDLIAYRPWSEHSPDGSYQVLSVQRPRDTSSPDGQPTLACDLRRPQG